jgi:hypothetical protein
MTRWLFIFAASIGFGIISSPSFARNCPVDYYDHNNSLMEVQVCHGTLDISYKQPRQGIKDAGVKVDDVLFEGKVSRNGLVTGLARLFSAKCGQITYNVTGKIGRTSIRLEGEAPVRNASCRVTKYRNDKLLFTLKTQAQRPTLKGNDWYVLTGAFKNKADADAKVRQLNAGGYNDWFVKNTRDCPNFTKGYWISTIGPLSKNKANEWRAWTKQKDAYIKTCN